MFLNLTPERFEGVVDGHPFDLDDNMFRIIWRDKNPGEQAAQRVPELFRREIGNYLGSTLRLTHFNNYCQDFGLRSRGVLLGRREAEGTVYYNEDPTHLITFGRTGYGKFVSNLAPTCLDYKGAMVVVDPKGEASAVTSRARYERHGQTPCLFDPFGIVREKLGGRLPPYAVEVSYNPLRELDPKKPRFFSDALRLTTGLLVSESEKEPIWRNNAIDLLSGVIMHVCSDPEETQRDLARVRDYLSCTRDGMQLLFKQMMLSPISAVQHCGARMQAMPENTFGGVKSQCDTDLLFLEDPLVREALSDRGNDQFSFEELLSNHLLPTVTEDDFAHFNSKLGYWEHRNSFLELLCSGGCTLYIVLPLDYTETHAGLLRLLISSFLSQSRRHERFGPPTLLLVDEAAQLKKLDMLTTAYSAGRANNLRVWTFWQDLGQLKAAYPKHHGSFTGNAVQILLGTTDTETSEYFSKIAGMEIKMVRSSQTVTEGRTWGEATSRGTSNSETEGVSSGYASGTSHSSGMSGNVANSSSGSSTTASFGRSSSQTNATSYNVSHSTGGSHSASYTDARVVEPAIRPETIRNTVGPEIRLGLVFTGKEPLFWVNTVRYYEERMRAYADPNPYHKPR